MLALLIIPLIVLYEFGILLVILGGKNKPAVEGARRAKASAYRVMEGKAAEVDEWQPARAKRI